MTIYATVFKSIFNFNDTPVSNTRTGFLLRFELAGTNVSIGGTKDGGRAAILARSAKSG